MKLKYDHTGMMPSPAAVFQRHWAPAKFHRKPFRKIAARVPLEEMITTQPRDQIRQTVVLVDLIILDSRLVIRDSRLAKEDK
jgi:hypothetical protein